MRFDPSNMSPSSSDFTEPSDQNQPWFVYIVRCADNTLYTGMTNDLLRRIDQHNAGSASRYTRVRRPVELVYQQQVESRSAALKREYAIKQLTRRRKDQLISDKLV